MEHYLNVDLAQAEQNFYFLPIFFSIFLLFFTQHFPASCSKVGGWLCWARLKVQRPQGHASVWVDV